MCCCLLSIYGSGSGNGSGLGFGSVLVWSGLVWLLLAVDERSRCSFLFSSRLGFAKLATKGGVTGMDGCYGSLCLNRISGVLGVEWDISGWLGAISSGL
jgi:hypothetical protein